MRSRRPRRSPSTGFLLAAFLPLMSPTSADAGLLDQAELRIRLRPQELSPPPASDATFPARGGAGFATAPSAASLLPGDAFAGSQQLTSSPLGTLLLSVGANQLGQFQGMPLTGPASFDANLCVQTIGFPSGVCVFTLPFGFGGATGTAMKTGFVATGGTPVPVSFEQRRFTTGVAVGGGTGTPPLFATGSNALDEDGNGTLTLVTPIRFAPVGAGAGMLSGYVGVAELELVFAPEPAAGLLLAWGAAWLAWVGARRSRR